MNVAAFRHVPWTCEWGRYGVAVQQVTPHESRVDDVFWVCHHPVIAPHLKALGCGECRTCPGWKPAARLLEIPGMD